VRVRRFDTRAKRLIDSLIRRKRRNKLKKLTLYRGFGSIAVACLLAGCAATRVSTKHVVAPAQKRTALDATKEALLDQFNQQANSVNSLNATVELSPTAGSNYSGVIEQYHRVSGFILAQKPAQIRMIGQAPIIASNIFDMVSDGQTFRIYIPSKKKFLVGPANLQRSAKNPIENLRPQHLLDALLWPPITPAEPVIFEEWNQASERYYVLSILRASSGADAGASAVAGAPTAAWELARKVWFDRADLSIVRLQSYGPAGRLMTDAKYSDWQPSGDVKYPRDIQLQRPHDDYQVEVKILKLTLNEPISADRFKLPQPPGTDLVTVSESGEATTGAQPPPGAAPKKPEPQT
jgi:outer membrane lipoprotein-sorting protein